MVHNMHYRFSAGNEIFTCWESREREAGEEQLYFPKHTQERMNARSWQWERGGGLGEGRGTQHPLPEPDIGLYTCASDPTPDTTRVKLLMKLLRRR